MTGGIGEQPEKQFEIKKTLLRVPETIAKAIVFFRKEPKDQGGESFIQLNPIVAKAIISLKEKLTNTIKDEEVQRGD